MTDFQMNDHIFQKECETLAEEIFQDVMEDAASDETAEMHRDTMDERVHETADGHEWVIYHHKAHHVCFFCNVDEGEAFLEDIGMPETPTYDGLATMIAFGEMRHRIMARVNELIEESEDEA